MSYWEWFKLIVTAVLISCAMTAVAVALGGSPPGRPLTMPKSTFEPCIPSRGTKVPDRPEWIHEIKHDGHRPIIQRDGKRVRL